MRTFAPLVAALIVAAAVFPRNAGAEGTGCGSPSTVAPDGRIVESAIPTATTFYWEVGTTAGRSYSVEVKFLTSIWSTGPTVTVYANGADCVGNVPAAGARNTTQIEPTVIPSGLNPGGIGGLPSGSRFSITAAGNQIFVKIDNATGGTPSNYSISASETTLYSPAWTTNGTFDTFYSMQNTTTSPINGVLTLLASGGGMTTVPIMIPADDIFGTNTASLGVMRNKVGRARFSHDGPPGAVVIKANQANFATSPPFIELVPFTEVRGVR
jgi:hypothetical protein